MLCVWGKRKKLYDFCVWMASFLKVQENLVEKNIYVNAECLSLRSGMIRLVYRKTAGTACQQSFTVCSEVIPCSTDGWGLQARVRWAAAILLSEPRFTSGGCTLRLGTARLLSVSCRRPLTLTSKVSCCTHGATCTCRWMTCCSS